jgi:hypothetical protein
MSSRAARPLPRWVNRVGLAAFRLLQLYPNERTSLPRVGMSEMPDAGRLLTRSCRSCAAHCRPASRDGSAVAGCRARRAGNAGADWDHASVEPARRNGDASTAAETGQGFSDCSVIAKMGALAADEVNWLPWTSLLAPVLRVARFSASSHPLGPS